MLDYRKSFLFFDLLDETKSKGCRISDLWECGRSYRLAWQTWDFRQNATLGLQLYLYFYLVYANEVNNLISEMNQLTMRESLSLH